MPYPGKFRKFDYGETEERGFTLHRNELFESSFIRTNPFYGWINRFYPPKATSPKPGNILILRFEEFLFENR